MDNLTTELCSQMQKATNKQQVHQIKGLQGITIQTSQQSL